VLLLGASACGFQLRGASNVPPEMQRTFIATDDRQSPFYRKLRGELRSSGVELVDSPADATAVFSILADDTDQRVLSVSARNVPREYEVYYTITYALHSGQTELMEPRTRTKTNDYTWDETEVLGKLKEQELLRNAIVDDLVRVVMIQLAAL
jgi:LPS-assembly lipoprotein